MEHAEHVVIGILGESPNLWGNKNFDVDMVVKLSRVPLLSIRRCSKNFPANGVSLLFS
jgi:hypothetical protein